MAIGFLTNAAVGAKQSDRRGIFHLNQVEGVE